MASATIPVCSRFPGSPRGGNQSGGNCTQLPNLPRPFQRVPSSSPQNSIIKKKPLLIEIRFIINIFGALVLWQFLYQSTRSLWEWHHVIPIWGAFLENGVHQSFTNSLQHSPQGQVFPTQWSLPMINIQVEGYWLMCLLDIFSQWMWLGWVHDPEFNWGLSPPAVKTAGLKFFFLRKNMECLMNLHVIPEQGSC